MEKKKKILLGIGSAAFVGISYFTIDYFLYVSTENAQVEAHTVMLGAKVAGLIQSVAVVEGQKVNKGDLLVEVDHRDFENTLTQVKAELASLEARKKDAEKNFQRLQSLLAQGAVSQAQFDTSSSGYLEIKSKYDAISSQVAQAQLNLENSFIRAPYAGVVAKRSAETGQFTAPGVPLLGFVGSDERWITANFKETDLESIKLGAEARIIVDAVSGRKFYGKVESISSATGSTFTLLPPDNATGNFTKVVQRVPVKISISNLKSEDFDLLRAGLSATVRVTR